LLLALLAFPALAAGQNGSDIGGAAQRAAATRPGSGDQIALNFLRDRELSATVQVNDRGEAVFPKIGIMRVTDMTIGELRDTLRVRYAEFLRLPEFEVAVLRRVVVNGEVRVPNVYMVDVASTVRDVIARAGGVTESGNRNNVVIIRGGERIKAKGWDGANAPITDVQSGDQIIVGRKNWLIMNALPVISTGVLVASFVISQLK
jgi:protein involved in polysaccharide export with SLBB domain